MTFQDVKSELARYNLGPGTELVVERGFGPRKLIRISFMMDRPNSDAKGQNPEDVSVRSCHYWPLRKLSPANIRTEVLELWRSYWEHELEEWLTMDGLSVFEPHVDPRRADESPG